MARYVLWIALVALLPLPYVLTDVGWVPASRLAVLSGATASVWIAEGEFVAGLIAALLGVQALLQAAIAYLVAGLVLRWVAPPRRAAVVVFVVLLLVGLAQLPIYRTPLSTQAARATMWGLLQ